MRSKKYNTNSKNSKLIALFYVLFVTTVLGSMLSQTIFPTKELLSPIPPGVVQVYAETPDLQEDATPEAELTIPENEKALILAYIVEVFGEHSADAITMIRKCENSSFDPRIISPLNVQKDGRRSYDVGIFQMNVDEKNTAEIARMQDWKYNIDQAFKKFQAKNNTFYYWTCGHVVGHYTYVDYLKGR